MKLIHVYFIPIILFFIIIILGSSLYAAVRIEKDGFTMPDIPGMVYNSYEIKATPMTSSDIISIITEITTDVNNNDTKLTLLDPSFQSKKINLKTNSFKTNIDEILQVMNKHDVEIKKLLPTYISSPDLIGLMDGTLLADKQKILYNMSNFPLSPSECSIEFMTQQLNDMKKRLNDKMIAAGPAPNPPPTVDPFIQAKIMITTKEDDIYELKKNLTNPNFTKCNPTMSKKDAEALFVGYQLHIMSKIVSLQNKSVNTIKDKKVGSIVTFYSGFAKPSQET